MFSLSYLFISIILIDIPNESFANRTLQSVEVTSTSSLITSTSATPSNSSAISTNSATSTISSTTTSKISTSLENLKDVTNDSSDIWHYETNPMIRYKKCHCNISQVWNETKCVDFDIEVLSDFLDVLSFHSALNDSLNQHISIEINDDLQCEFPEQVTRIVGPGLILAENGTLYHEQSATLFPMGDYCFEINNEINILELFVNVCLPPPVLPYCCNNSKCENIDYFQNLSVSFLGQNLIWQDYDFIYVEEPKCEGLEVKKTEIFSKNTSNVSLRYGYGEAELVYTETVPIKNYNRYSLLEYCIKLEDSKLASATFCYQDPIKKHKDQCREAVCVRKCCPIDKVYSLIHKKCLPALDTSDLLQLTFYDENLEPTTQIPHNLVIEEYFPWCNRSYFVEPHEFHLQINGKLFVSSSNLSLPSSKYCIENFHHFDGSISTNAIGCFLKDVKEEERNCFHIVHKIIYPILIIISCVFLTITLIVYASLPELRAKLHGRCLLSHVSSLLGAFLCQLVVIWGSKDLSMVGCKLMALGNQVSFLWAFFWLNVMCLDIWWTLKSMSPSPETGESSRKKFIYYSIYAWGCPILISSVTCFLEFLPKSIDASGLILPGFGVRSCWFQDTKSTWIYFHGFTLFLYVMNILFFFHVAAILIKGQRSTEGILRKTRKQQKERVYLYLKLFIVMGITWICEVASWQEGTCHYWIFTDIINSLQGVFIFFIFMCNRKVYQKMHAKGLPFFTYVKTRVRNPSSVSRRTTQTSDHETSSRRSSNSLTPSDSNVSKKLENFHHGF